MPVHLLDPDRPVLDRRCQRNTHVKKQNPMNVVFSIGSMSLFDCVCVSEIYPKKESSKVKTEKMVYKKKLKPKTRKMKTMKNV